MWVKQDQLYDTAKKAHEVGERITTEDNISIEEVDTVTGASKEVPKSKVKTR